MTNLNAADEAVIAIHSTPIKRAKREGLFTLSQIDDLRSKMKNGAGFPTFVRALKSLGVTGYDLFVNDRHGEYFGRNSFSIKEEAKYPTFAIASKLDKEKLASFLKTYNLGKTNYMTFYEQIAHAGIEKWTLNAKMLTSTYYDASGTAVIVEHLPAQ